MLLGCIADDFTGATDLANTLTQRGMATMVLLGVPDASVAVPDADAVVIALRSRSNAAAEAVSMSLAALSWLQHANAQQFYFKYCSTFDSTDAGNIGPVAEALMDALSADFTVACPAFPTNRRTVYQGHLFVGDQLLSESGMRHHPLNPMTDALLTRVLQCQCKHKVGLIALDVVARGAAAIRGRIAELRGQGVRIAIVDAITDGHLIEIAAACADMKLLSGGSGLALGLADNFRNAGLLATQNASALPHIGGHAAVIAGSCSETTNTQVIIFKQYFESYPLDPLTLVSGLDATAQALAWARERVGAKPILIYSTAEPQKVAQAQSTLGRERAGQLIEQAMARIAQGLVELGVRRMVVAGGETSGAVVGALGVRGLRIGPEIDPGVPWTAGIGADPIALALKSGNFGSEDFFARAFDVLTAHEQALTGQGQAAHVMEMR